ncbi:T9SS type A sorting domain-containing protein [Flavisolibacter ginsenosidimutans]|uniref:T9SS type A sorting domain-containing protein n=1 Tax=Flavisolibacter ginsenosidimutans TaxID=661481 RepID=A0A5B8UNL0_9BACT|nr:T9SS type A sorting domain-containing protein [Flavisolibacter ginsenosidimutans]QEC58153.1 T9SS type A sorting domain-containing protein [Flavisolibacter ginsenosidimutans]
MKTKFLQAVLIMASLHGAAQKAATVFGNVQIYPGASVTAVGDFSITSTGNFINNGTLYAKANVNNSQASMTAGTGTLYLNGTTQQTVGGTAAFKTANLTTANAAGVLLNTDLSVSGMHTFSSGQIFTAAAPTYLIYESGSSYSGDNDAAHVVGWVKKNGSSSFAFPVGNTTVERTIQLSSLSAASSFAVNYFRTTPNRFQLASGFVQVDSSEYWQVNEISGGTATVTLNWNNNKVPFFNWSLADIRVAGYNGANWIPQGGTATGNTATTGTISSSQLSSFNLFTFGATSYVLPLRLLSFTAKRGQNDVGISWKVADEKDVAYYAVERSDNGFNFYPLTQLFAHNSGNVEGYTCTDYAAITTAAYYRLKWTNTNGTAAYSSVVKVDGAIENNALALQFNPVKDRLVLLASPQLKGLFQFRIFSATAQLVQTGRVTIEGGGRYELPLTGTMPPGNYTINISDASQSFTLKFVVR